MSWQQPKKINMKKISLAAVVFMLLLFASCKKGEADSVQYPNSPDDMQSYESSAEANGKIIFSGYGVQVSGTGAKAKKSEVVISSPGLYELSGSGTGVGVKVDCEGEVTLLLCAVELSDCEHAVYSVKDCTLTLNVMDGAENKLSSRDSTLYSKGVMTISGKGKLIVSSDSKHGVETKGALTLCQSDIGITAEKDGVRSKGTVTVSHGASVKAECGGNGIYSQNSVLIDENTDIMLSCGKNGIRADEEAEIRGGSLQITESCEGIEACRVTISGGSVEINAADDGINISQSFDKADENAVDKHDVNEACLLDISGGNIVVNASGDGVDSNGNIRMTGGALIIYGPTDNKNGAVDYNGTFKMDGGILLAVGSGGMAQAPSDGKQHCLITDLPAQKGGRIEIKDSKGELIIRCDAPKYFDNIVASHSLFSKTKSVGIYVDGVLLAKVKTGGSK